MGQGKSVEQETQPGKDALRSFVKPQVLLGPARLEQELAVISCVFQSLCLPSNSQRYVLRRHKLSELVLYLAD
jgi:hypothetical protein